MKAIIHIGAPKTGSSSIQKFLNENARDLACQGFRYHRNAPYRRSHIEYPLAALAQLDMLLPNVLHRSRYNAATIDEQKKLSAKTLSDLARDVKRWKEPVAIFSSEHIYPWMRRREIILALDKVFAEHFDERKYVLYIRNQPNLLTSQFSESVKRGSLLGLNKFVARRLKSLDYYPRIRDWVDAVGRDRFVLRLMEKSFLTNGDLIDDFCDVCGIDPTHLIRPPHVNEALSHAAAQCLLVMNRRVPELLPEIRTDQPLLGRRQRLRIALSRISEKCLLRQKWRKIAAPSGRKFNPVRRGVVNKLLKLSVADPRLRLTPDLHAKVSQFVVEGNERIRQEFFPQRGALFSDTPEDIGFSQDVINRRAFELTVQLFIESRHGRLPKLSRIEQYRAYDPVLESMTQLSEQPEQPETTAA